MEPDNSRLTSAKEPGQGYHDFGGLDGGPIDTDVTQAKPWEKLAVVVLPSTLTPVPTVGISADGRRVASMWGNNIRIRDVVAGKVLYTKDMKAEKVAGAAGELTPGNSGRGYI
jgi:hypothetical protein